jgi:hypothetical protein
MSGEKDRNQSVFFYVLVNYRQPLATHASLRGTTDDES